MPPPGAALSVRRRQTSLGNAGFEVLDALAHGRLQRPDVALPGKEIKAPRGAVEPRVEVSHQPAQRLAVALGRRRHTLDRGRELPVRELTRDAQRAGEIEMADP